MAGEAVRDLQAMVDASAGRMFWRWTRYSNKSGSRYRILVQAGDYDGRPITWGDVFPSCVSLDEALDHVAGWAVSYFRATAKSGYSYPSFAAEHERVQLNWAGETVCNLYKMTAPAEAIGRLFGTRHGTNLQPFDDIYPDREAPVVRGTSNGEREIAVMHWGFPPPPNAGSRPVTNVRNLSSPFWKSALAKPAQRCLVPVTQFCEWTGEKGSKRKVWFEVTDQEVFAFAGIWRPTDDGAHMAFLTCEPNALVGKVHPKAMPVILGRDDYDAWLGGSYDDAMALARPYPDEAMRIVD